MTTGVILLIAGLSAVAIAAILVAVRAARRPVRQDFTGAIEAHGLRLDRVADALGRQVDDGRELRAGVGSMRQALEELRVRAAERERSENTAWEAIRRLEGVLVGGGSRGRAGENLLHELLSSLPPGMLVPDYQVNGKTVEFALGLPDGRHLPVDSKWTAIRELEALEATEDPMIAERAARAVEREVAKRAREVGGYIDPSATTPFAVACVPDAAYATCTKAHAAAFRSRVVIVPYSTALPVLLSLYVLAGRFGGTGDVDACLAELDSLLGSMEQTLENKVVRPTTVLQNASGEWREQLARARAAVSRGRGVLGDGGEPEHGERSPSLQVVE